MTRIKEPEPGSTEIPKYKSPPSRIVRSLRKGYDNVRKKVKDKANDLQDLRGKLRDTQKSRDTWKDRCKITKNNNAKLREEIERLKKRASAN